LFGADVPGEWEGEQCSPAWQHPPVRPAHHLCINWGDSGPLELKDKCEHELAKFEPLDMRSNRLLRQARGMRRDLASKKEYDFFSAIERALLAEEEPAGFYDEKSIVFAGKDGPLAADVYDILDGSKGVWQISEILEEQCYLEMSSKSNKAYVRKEPLTLELFVAVQGWIVELKKRIEAAENALGFL
jgi:hypothetical protein